MEVKKRKSYSLIVRTYFTSTSTFMAPSEPIEENPAAAEEAEDQNMEDADSEAGSSKMTIEERKAKMDQLRKRLVSTTSLYISSQYLA